VPITGAMGANCRGVRCPLQAGPGPHHQHLHQAAPHEAPAVGPGKYCSPRHRMPFIPETRVQNALEDIARHVCERVQNALDDMARYVREALPCRR